MERMCKVSFKQLILADVFRHFKVRWKSKQNDIWMVKDKSHSSDASLMSLPCHFRFSRGSVLFLRPSSFSHFLQVQFFLSLHTLNAVGKFLGSLFTKQGLNVSQEKEKGNGLFELNSFLRHFPLNQCGQNPSGPKPLVDTFTNLYWWWPSAQWWLSEP